MDVDVDAVGRQRQQHDAERKAARRQEFAVAAGECERQRRTFHQPRVDEEILPGTRVAVPVGRTEDAGHADAFLGQRRLRVRQPDDVARPVAAQHGLGAAFHVRVPRGVEHLPPVRAETEMDVGVRQRQPDQRVVYLMAFRGRRLEEGAPRRCVEEDVARGHRRAGRAAGGRNLHVRPAFGPHTHALDGLGRP